MAIKTLPRIESRALERFTRTLHQRFGDDLVLIKLYGSKARGDWHRESDIDVFVVLDQLTLAKKQFIEQSAWHNYEKLGVRINPIIYSLIDYEDATHPPTAFMYFINKEGITLYERN